MSIMSQRNQFKSSRLLCTILQTDFEIVLLFLTHLRLHDVNVDIIKNYAFSLTYYLNIHLMLALSHYVVI